MSALTADPWGIGLQLVQTGDAGVRTGELEDQPAHPVRRRWVAPRPFDLWVALAPAWAWWMAVVCMWGTR